MQKSLVIVLTVCLISAHAFVRREAPAGDNTNYLDTLQKQFGDFSKQINDKLKTTFDPEELKKGFNDVMNTLNKTFEDIKSKSEAEKKAAQ